MTISYSSSSNGGNRRGNNNSISRSGGDHTKRNWFLERSMSLLLNRADHEIRSLGKSAHTNQLPGWR